MKTILTMISAGLLFVATSCNKSQDVQPADKSDASERTAIQTLNINGNGLNDRVDQRIVYFNNLQYAVQLKSNAYLQPAAGATRSNTLYVIKSPAGTDIQFLAVASALPVTAYDAGVLWQAVELNFTGPYSKPYQITSADEVTRLLALSTSGLVAVKTNTYFEMQMAPLKDQPPAIQ